MARKRKSAQKHQASTAASAQQKAQRLPYFPALDGLRAVAVAVVLLYHAGTPILGGYLGVETFFVLSGFLITALLLNEVRNDGKINLYDFWLRRARRLLPALGVTLLGAFLLTLALRPSELAGLGRDLLAAVSYVMNWHLIASEQDRKSVV